MPCWLPPPGPYGPLKVTITYPERPMQSAELGGIYK